MDTPWPAEAVAAESLTVGQSAGFFDHSTTRTQVLAGTDTARGMWVHVAAARNAEPWASWNPLFTTFKFTQTTHIWLRMDKFTGFAAQEKDMVRLAARLLERVPGNLALWMPDSDLLWLLRLDGDLILNDRDELWPADRLSLITLPYRRAPLTLDD